MLKNYLHITLRHFKKNKTFLTINILGLGLACACCIIAYINYDYAKSFDGTFLHQEKIYRINREWITLGETVRHGQAPLPLVEHIRQNMPQVEHVVPYVPLDINVRTNDDIFNTPAIFVGPAFFEVFSYEFVYGNGLDFDKNSNILISDELSYKYFGDEDPIGKQISFILPAGSVEFIVTGVFKKKPLNSSIQTDAIVNFENYLNQDVAFHSNEWRLNVGIFLNLRSPYDATTVEQAIQKYVAIENSISGESTTRYYLDPFRGMADRVRETEVKRHKMKGGLTKMQTYTPAVLSLAILLVACFNFTNTSIAASANRLKEIGIRKVLGSAKSQLVFRFITENIMVTMLGLLAGLVFASFLVPVYSSMWSFLDIDVHFMHNTDLLFFLFLLLLFTGLAAGSYPAFYISSFNPSIIFKGNAKFSGTNFFTRGLLFVQFMLCVMLLVLGFSFLENARYQAQRDLGFDVEGVLVYEMGDKYYESVKKDLLANPEVMDVTAGAHHLWWYNYAEVIRDGSDEVETMALKVSDEYLEFMGIKVIQGRDFVKGSTTDEVESVIINETFAKTFGWDNPLGKRILVRDTVPFYVVGVVKDFHTNHVWETIVPVMFRLGRTEDINYMVVRVRPDKTREVDRFCKSLFINRYPELGYNGGLMVDELENAKMLNANAVQLFLFLGMMALVLTTTGLYSLVSLNIIKRLKEIGIRKVFGATEWQIVKKLNREFVIILTISLLVGLPLAYHITLFFMENAWTYFQETTFTTMLLTVMIVLVVAFFTLAVKVVGAARTNPVDTLRND
ncbi:MAG: ABC transporter permease [Cyclobacteriaceae bacterium]|nr:ABC transporter permease [Cyclobacteriaceae bacterium]